MADYMSGNDTGMALTPSPPAQHPMTTQSETANLADILTRVLDRGIVIAGDIQINLLDIELLTIKLRLIVASVDTARQMGINWWETDESLRSGSWPAKDSRRLAERVEQLERRLEAGEPADAQRASEPADAQRDG